MTVEVSTWFLIASLILTSLAMQPNIATVIVQFLNVGVLIGLRTLARREGARATIKHPEV